MAVNCVLFPCIVFPSPANCTHAHCCIFVPTNCSHIMFVCVSNGSTKHCLVFADVDICTIVADDCRCICVKGHGSILQALIDIEHRVMHLEDWFLPLFLPDAFWYRYTCQEVELVSKNSECKVHDCAHVQNQIEEIWPKHTPEVCKAWVFLQTSSTTTQIFDEALFW